MTTKRQHIDSLGKIQLNPRWSIIRAKYIVLTFQPRLDMVGIEITYQAKGMLASQTEPYDFRYISIHEFICILHAIHDDYVLLASEEIILHNMDGQQLVITYKLRDKYD